MSNVPNRKLDHLKARASKSNKMRYLYFNTDRGKTKRNF